jgi:hypothetical protein
MSATLTNTDRLLSVPGLAPPASLCSGPGRVLRYAFTVDHGTGWWTHYYERNEANVQYTATLTEKSRTPTFRGG